MIEFMNEPSSRYSLGRALGVSAAIALATILVSLVIVVVANPFVDQPDGPVLLIVWFMTLPLQVLGSAVLGYLYSTGRRRVGPYLLAAMILLVLTGFTMLLLLK